LDAIFGTYLNATAMNFGLSAGYNLACEQHNEVNTEDIFGDYSNIYLLDNIGGFCVKLPNPTHFIIGQLVGVIGGVSGRRNISELFVNSSQL